MTIHLYGYLNPIQQYFSYIVAVRFINGGKCSTYRIPIVCRKSLYRRWIFINISSISCKIGEIQRRVKTQRYLILCPRLVSVNFYQVP
jgi:hypothetical protein